ncbi:MAG: PDZ domain-containing protein [Verrucomicrobiota bacterium]|nr:PDZ domain-containing protein [Verrucomicrobiota bacterium]
MSPTLSKVFPIFQSKEGVQLFQTILIGDNLVLERGTTLRNLYAAPLSGDRDVRIVAAEKQMEQAYTSNKNKIKTKKDALTPKEQATKRRMEEVVWTDKKIFLEALDHSHDQSLDLSYIDLASKEVRSVPFNFFEGLLLAQQGDIVTILAIDTDGRAAGAGLKSGDKILAINGKNLNGDLKNFAEFYAKATASSGIERPKIEFNVFRNGKQELITFKPPVSLNGSFF